MKVYIAGKISGDPAYLEKFRLAERAITEQGDIALNPAALPEGMRPDDYMRICFAMMESADVVAFLPDWYESRGVGLEYSWCQYTSKLTMYLESMSFYMGGDDHFRPFKLEKTPMTNADRIRAMSDEELAKFIMGKTVNYCHTGLCLDGETCVGCYLKWLQQTAEEELSCLG